MKKVLLVLSFIILSVNSLYAAIRAVVPEGNVGIRNEDLYSSNKEFQDQNNFNQQSGINLKILGITKDGDDIKVKAILEDKSNPVQYNEFKFTAMNGGAHLESFQFLENNEWKKLDSYPIDRFGFETVTQALVDMYCEYNSEQTFYLPKYIAGNPSRDLPNPVRGHFKLLYCGYEVEFDINENSLVNNSRNNDLNLMPTDENIDNKQSGGGSYETMYDATIKSIMTSEDIYDIGDGGMNPVGKVYYYKHQFYDLNGDNIPELIIYRKSAYNNVYIDRAFTIVKGSVVPFDLSSYGSVDSEKFNTAFGNILASDYRTGGTRDEVFYALTDGRVARVSYHWGAQDGIVIYDFKNRTTSTYGNVTSLIGTLPGNLLNK